jgi:hypothetical protein
VREERLALETDDQLAFDLSAPMIMPVVMPAVVIPSAAVTPNGNGHRDETASEEHGDQRGQQQAKSFGHRGCDGSTETKFVALQKTPHCRALAAPNGRCARARRDTS